jgi:hypothetical protein
MPTIPGTLQPVSTDVMSPQIAVPAGTETANAVSRLGNTIAQSSVDLLEKVKQAEAIETSSKAFFDDRYASEDYMTQLKLKYPDGYMLDDKGQKIQNQDGSYKTITQSYRDWANDRYLKNQESMPTEMAKQLYIQRAGQYFNDGMIKVRGDELVLRTQSFENDQETRKQFGMNRLVDIPDVQSAYQLIDSHTTEYKGQQGILLSGNQVHDETMKLQQQIPEALFQGMYSQVLSEPKKGQSRNDRIDYAMSVLQGQDPDSLRRQKLGLSTISDMMKPEQKARAEQELLRLRDVAQKLDMSDWHAKMGTAKNQVEIELRNPGNAAMRRQIPFAPLYQQGYELLQAGKISEFEFTQNVSELIAKDAGRAIFTSPSFLLASPEQKQKFIDQAVQLAQKNFDRFTSPEIKKSYPYIDANFNKIVIDQLQKIASTTDQEAHKDFVDFSQYSPDIKRQTATLSANQAFTNPQVLWKMGKTLQQRTHALQSMGDTYFGYKHPDFRVISQDESQQLSGFLKNDLTNYSKAADGLMALKSADPDHYATIIDQMIRDKNLSPEWRLTLVNKNRTLTAEIVRTIKDGQKIRENANSFLEANGVKASDFDAAIQKEAGGYLAALTQSNQDSTVAENERILMRNVLVTKAMDLYRQENGARDPSKYAEDVTKAFFGNQYKLISGGNSSVKKMFGLDAGGPSYALVPKVLGGRVLSEDELSNAESNRSAFLQPENLKTLGAVPPKGLDKTGVDPEKFYEQVQSTGRLVNTGDNKTFRVEWYNREIGTYVPVTTGKKGRNGLPVPLTIPMEKIISPAPQKKPLAKPKPSDLPQDNRPWYQKVYDNYIKNQSGQ